MHQKLVTVFGGSGFVGTQLIQQLARAGHRIRVATRRPDLAQHLRPLGAVGQFALIQANIRNKPSIDRATAGADAVVNLVGIPFERGRQRFHQIHTLGAGTIAESARSAGAASLIHMSALGADENAASVSARSKALGEKQVLKAFPDAVIIRPSIIFGTDDGFFNLFGALARLSPVLPLVGAGTRFQPVYAGDVAEAFAAAIAGKVKTGRTYELGGGEIETMRELLARVLHLSGRGNPLIPLPDSVARFVAFFLQFLPNPVLTPDQVAQLGTDNVVSEEAIRQNRTLAAFGIHPTTMDAILPTYMWRFRRRGQFETIEDGPAGQHNG